MGVHDSGYKKLFSRKENFLKFLNTFVKKDWINFIDPDSLILIDKQFHLEGLQQRESDMIYRVNIEGEEVYFYILTELQSSVDYTIPYRFFVYMAALLGRDFSSTPEEVRERKDFKLPCVIPILLYTGLPQKWTVSPNFKDYLHKSDLFGNSVMNFSYIVVDLHGYTEETLLELEDLISLVFALDKKRESDGVKRILIAGMKIFKKFSFQEQSDFEQWLKDVLLSKCKDPKLIESFVNDFKSDNKEGMEHNMVAFLNDVEKKGIEKGIEQGIGQGVERVAKMMLDSDEPIEKIVKFTGLSVEEIERIKADL